MLFKDRVIIYSWTHKKVDYLSPFEFTTDVCIRIFDSFGNLIEYWAIPRWCNNPANIESYCKGLEDSWKDLKLDRHIERSDYEY